MKQYLDPLSLAAAALTAAVVLVLLRGRTVEEASWGTGLALFLAAFTLEYAILGHNSFINMDSEGNLMVVADHYLALHPDSQFSHAFGGGQDMYVWFLGKQYFQPEKLLIAWLPTWVAILLHKLMVGTLSFVGVVLLIRRLDPQAGLYAMAAAAAIAISHDYLTNFSTSFGTGFAALPLTVYLTVVRSTERNYWPGAAMAVVLMTAADPVKVFPSLAPALVGAVILFSPVHLGRALTTLTAIVVAALLNWHEVLYALAQGSEIVGRGYGVGIDGATPLSEAVVNTMAAMLHFHVPTVLCLAALGVLAWRRDPFLLRAVLAVVWIATAIIVADATPWDRIGLELINRLSHQQYMVLALIVVVPPILGRALRAAPAGSAIRSLPALPIAPGLLLLSLAAAALTWKKVQNFATLFMLGGQGDYHRVAALTHPDWLPPDTDRHSFRTVSLYEAPTSNIVAGFYGFDTFDGQMNLNNKYWGRYWSAVMYDDPSHNLTTRIGWRWDLWDGKAYDAGRHVRLDLLAAANVRYLLSPLPLATAGLRLVHEAARAYWLRGSPEIFGGMGGFLRHQLRVLAGGGDIFVYELADPAPRLYAATAVVNAPAAMDHNAYYDLVSAAVAKRQVVVSDADAGIVGQAAPMTIETWRAVEDGYDVTLSAPEGGILVVNTTYWPWWQATADGRDLPLVAADGVHLAVTVPAGARNIRIRYHRPMLRDKF